MKDYFRPLVQIDRMRPDGAHRLAGGWGWFTHVEHLSRAGSHGVIGAEDVPKEWLDSFTSPRKPLCDFDYSAPILMGILNVTPDSFSDGGQFNENESAALKVADMLTSGADILDIGGESTRPGAAIVPEAEEIERVAPVIRAIMKAHPCPISIDTRKAAVARAALDAGAAIVNDVAALRFDPAIATLAAERSTPVCLMHAQGDPETMQEDPSYANVLLDVFDFLEESIDLAATSGIHRDDIIVDPGIGFGKTLSHNIALLDGLSLFHGLGCPILLGASRKRLIGEAANAPDPGDRLGGSIAIALSAIAQGVQIIRAHDIKETRQAMTLWAAVNGQNART